MVTCILASPYFDDARIACSDDWTVRDHLCSSKVPLAIPSQGVNLMGKFNQVANMVSPSVTTSNVQNAVSRNDSANYAADWASDDLWGFPLAAVSVTSNKSMSTSTSSIRNIANETPVSSSQQPFDNTSLPRLEERQQLRQHLNSQVPAAFSSIIKLLQDVWAYCLSTNIIISSNTESSTNATTDPTKRDLVHQFCVCVSRTVHRILPFVVSLPDMYSLGLNALLRVSMKVFLLDSQEIFSLSQRTKLLIALEEILRNRNRLGYLQATSSVSTKTDVETEKIPTDSIATCFEDSIIYKFAAVVFDSKQLLNLRNLKTELLVFQNQIVLFMLSMLSKYGDEMVAVLLGIPVRLVTEGSGAHQSTSPQDAQGIGKRRRSNSDEQEWNENLNNNSKSRAREGGRQTESLFRSPGAKQGKINTSSSSSELLTQESPTEPHKRVSQFDWEQHLVRQHSEASSARFPAAQKSLLHGLCQHWLFLARDFDGRDVTDDLQDALQEVQLVVGLTALLNGVAGRMTHAQWVLLMREKVLDINIFLVRWHINLHPVIRKRISSNSLSCISCF